MTDNGSLAPWHPGPAAVHTSVPSARAPPDSKTRRTSSSHRPLYFSFFFEPQHGRFLLALRDADIQRRLRVHRQPRRRLRRRDRQEDVGSAQCVPRPTLRSPRSTARPRPLHPRESGYTDDVYERRFLRRVNLGPVHAGHDQVRPPLSRLRYLIFYGFPLRGISPGLRVFGTAASCSKRSASICTTI